MCNTILIVTCILLVIVIYRAIALLRASRKVALSYESMYEKAVDGAEEIINLYAHEKAIKRHKLGTEAYKYFFENTCNELRTKISG